MSTPSPAATRAAQFDAFLRQDPDNAGLLLEAFDAHLQAGHFDAAQFHLVHATRLGYDPARWDLNGVHLALARGEWEAAEAQVRQLSGRAAQPPELVAALAHAGAYANFRLDRFDASAQALEPLLAEPEDRLLAAATQALVLRVWHRLYQFERAIAWAAARFQDGILAPEAAGAASLVALDAGDFATSARFAQASLASGVPCAEALVSASSLATARRDAATGQTLARQALELNPNDGRSWSALGLAQMLAGDLHGARVSFHNAVRTMPGHQGTWIAMGWTEFLLGEDAAALQTFEKSVEIDRNFGEAHGGLAVIQAKLGRREDALASIERARRLDAAGLSLRFAQRLLEGGDIRDDRALLLLARRLLGERASPLGGTMADWLPQDGEPPAA